MKKEEYVMPESAVIIINMETGFATSPGDGSNEPGTGDDY